MQPTRRCCPVEQLIIKAKPQEFVDAGVVYKHKGPTRCAVNTVVAAKKDLDTGMWTEHRMAQDYQSVSQFTPHDQYIMRRPEEIFQKLGKAVVFSKLDLRVPCKFLSLRGMRPKLAIGSGTVSWPTTACRVTFGNARCMCYALSDDVTAKPWNCCRRNPAASSDTPGIERSIAHFSLSGASS